MSVCYSVYHCVCLSVCLSTGGPNMTTYRPVQTCSFGEQPPAPAPLLPTWGNPALVLTNPFYQYGIPQARPQPQPVWTCSLCSPYIYEQAGGWPSTQMPSCLYVTTRVLSCSRYITHTRRCFVDPLWFTLWSGDQGFTLNIVTDGKLNGSPKISPATMSVLGSISIVLAFGRKPSESNVFVHMMLFLAERNIEIFETLFQFWDYQETWYLLCYIQCQSSFSR